MKTRECDARPESNRSSPARTATTLSVKTDPETLRLYHSACRALGGTIQDTTNKFMRDTIARAGLDQPNQSARSG